eukprot:scaffold7576_cov114-Isochrysis_galbana.AAC.4
MPRYSAAHGACRRQCGPPSSASATHPLHLQRVPPDLEKAAPATTPRAAGLRLYRRPALAPAPDTRRESSCSIGQQPRRRTCVDGLVAARRCRTGADGGPHLPEHFGRVKQGRKRAVVRGGRAFGLGWWHAVGFRCRAEQKVGQAAPRAVAFVHQLGFGRQPAAAADKDRVTGRDGGAGLGRARADGCPGAVRRVEAVGAASWAEGALSGRRECPLHHEHRSCPRPICWKRHLSCERRLTLAPRAVGAGPIVAGRRQPAGA